MPKILISAFPTLKIALLTKSRNSGLKYLLSSYNCPKIKFLFLGRSAIWHAVKMLNLKENDVIMMPSYHCSVEVEAILQAGAKIKFFEIDNNMNADLKDIETKIDENTKAIFIIHYFGFPQPILEIKKICENYKLYLIEDCAHAFLSSTAGRYLGTFGDFGILSMQKFLPLPNGGVLLINNTNFKKHFKLIPPNEISVIRSLFLNFLNNLEINHNNAYQIINLSMITLIKKFLNTIKKQSNLKIINPTSVDFNLSMANLAMSNISKRILNNIDFNKMIIIRRQNYNFLLEKLKNIPQIKICFPKLPQGVCPYFFPIEVKNNCHLYEKLKKQGIYTFIFGEFLHNVLPQEGFDTARYLSKHILALPIHQDLNQNQLQYMVNSLKNIL